MLLVESQGGDGGRGEVRVWNSIMMTLQVSPVSSLDAALLHNLRLSWQTPGKQFATA